MKSLQPFGVKLTDELNLNLTSPQRYKTKFKYGMKTLIIISISIILTLVVYSSVKQRKVVSCLSDCYYQCGSLFTVGMLLVAAMMTPVALTVNDGVVSFMMMASLAFIGVAADYQGTSDMERKVHVVSAYVACAAAVVFSLSSFPSDPSLADVLTVLFPALLLFTAGLLRYDSRLLCYELTALSMAAATCWVALE
jgi:hypothetical protein